MATKGPDKSLLRFITCGSVDDGKSTLIGRLLYEGQFLFDDQLAALRTDSRQVGTQGQDLDFALLVDGLSAEREQGITIDVAYRFFSTPRRQFIVADTPGHEQYTRNMATGASTADLAVILVDASKGSDLLVQTKRHTIIASMLGIRHFILAVNKMDTVDYQESAFEALRKKYLAFAHDVGVTDVHCVPISALRGDNVISNSAHTPWYRGQAILPLLETIDPPDAQERPFRMPVQWVNRSKSEFRGFAGTIASGRIMPGSSIRVLPSAHTANISRIVTKDGDLDLATQGQAVTIVLDREIDVSRGDLLSSVDLAAPVADQFAVHLLWTATAEMLPGRTYLLKIATATVHATVTALKHKVNVNTLEHTAAPTLQLNEIGYCNLSLSKPVAFEPYRESRDLGSFILIDRLSNQTVGMGMIDFALYRANNIQWQSLQVTAQARAAQKGQKAAVLWFTGLSGSGKSTIATALEKRLFGLGLHTYVLDGDNIRHGLNRDLGFTNADRVENIRRVAEVARLMTDAGILTLVSFISPFSSERQMARNLFPQGDFIEIFVDAPLAVCEERDPKGLYRKARRNEIRNFTGFDSPYEAPANPEIHLDTTKLSAEDAVEFVLDYLVRSGLISSGSLSG